jgi:hypothetical protein
MPSLLVVGPDRVGKTTLVKHMSEITGMPSFKCPSEKEIFREGGRSSLTFDYTLTHFLEQTGHHFISDRAYPCEWVYSKVFKRETDDELLELIDAAHARLGTIVVNVFSSVAPREEDDLVPAEKYWDVAMMYQGFRMWTDCQHLTVDTAKMLEVFQNGGDISRQVAEDVLEQLNWHNPDKKEWWE